MFFLQKKVYVFCVSKYKTLLDSMISISLECYRTLQEGQSSCDVKREGAHRGREQGKIVFHSLDLKSTLRMIKSNDILFSNEVYEIQMGEITYSIPQGLIV